MSPISWSGRWKAGVVLAGLALIAAPAAIAHHSGAMFDRTQDVVLKGTIKEVQFTSPHAWLQVLVPDTAGKQVEWSIEFGGGGQSLFGMGFTKTAPGAGDKVAVTIHPLRDGRPGGSFVSMVLPDGRMVGGTRRS